MNGSRGNDADQQLMQILPFILDSPSLFVIKTDHEGRYTFVNKTFRERFFPGQEEDKILGTLSLHTILEEDHALCIDTVKKCMECPGKTFSVALRKPLPSGGLHVNQWDFRAIADSQGEACEILCTGHSVTERIKTEEEQRLILENINGVLTAINHFGDFTYVSPSWTRLYGYLPEETLGRSFEGFVHPDDWEPCRIALHNLIVAGQNPVLEHRVRHKNGSWRWLATQGNLHPLSGDVILVSQDVTEIHKSNEMLHQSGQMLKNVLEQITGVVFWKDLQGKYLGCNKAFARAAGYADPAEIFGKTDFDLPWKDTEASAYVQDDQKVIASGEPRLDIIETQHEASGNLVWYNTSKLPLRNSKGEIIGVMGISIDISHLKLAEEAIRKSEEQFRFIAQHTSDAIIRYEQGNYTFISASHEKLTGYSGEELSHLSTDEIIDLTVHPEDGPIIRSRLRSAIADCKADLTYQYRYKRKDGSWFWREDNASFFYNQDHSLQFAIIVARDISARIQNFELEKEMQVARKTLDFKQRFLANMSHEIRTPLTGVLGMAEILSSTTLDAQQREYLQVLMQSGETLREIVNMVLDYSKIEAGQIQENSQLFSFTELLKAAENLFKGLNKKDLEFETFCDPLIPGKLIADMGKIQQIIANLLSNAYKFTPHGKVVLKAFCENPPHEPSSDTVKVRIVVQDTGIGIDPADQEKLFKPYVQAQQQEQQPEGTGLGLAISKELSRILKGEMGFESTPGSGSSFWFSFLAKVGKEEKVQTEQRQGQADLPPRKLKILVAEDQAVNQKVLQIMIQGLGHEITIAANGVEVLEKFQPGVFDLILMDMRMPLMDGITATQNLREKYSKLPPIVGLSANALEGDKEFFMQQGLDGYISKPMKINDLKELLTDIGSPWK